MFSAAQELKRAFLQERGTRESRPCLLPKTGVWDGVSHLLRVK